MPADPSTNASLLQRAQDNDQQAWDQLVHLYGPLIHRWCRQVGLQESDTADIFQETFRSVSKQLASFSPRRAVGSFRSWLKVIVRHKIVDHIRQLGDRPTARGGSKGQEQFANVPDPLNDESIEEAAEENALLVQRAMEMIRGEFTPNNWRAFQMVVEGQRPADVARDLQLKPAAVRQANYRIRRRLRLVLQDLIDE